MYSGKLEHWSPSKGQWEDLGSNQELAFLKSKHSFVILASNHLVARPLERGLWQLLSLSLFNYKCGQCYFIGLLGRLETTCRKCSLAVSGLPSQRIQDIVWSVFLESWQSLSGLALGDNLTGTPNSHYFWELMLGLIKTALPSVCTGWLNWRVSLCSSASSCGGTSVPAPAAFGTSAVGVRCSVASSVRKEWGAGNEVLESHGYKLRALSFEFYTS